VGQIGPVVKSSSRMFSTLSSLGYETLCAAWKTELLLPPTMGRPGLKNPTYEQNYGMSGLLLQPKLALIAGTQTAPCFFPRTADLMDPIAADIKIPM